MTRPYVTVKPAPSPPSLHPTAARPKLGRAELRFRPCPVLGRRVIEASEASLQIVECFGRDLLAEVHPSSHRMGEHGAGATRPWRCQVCSVFGLPVKWYVSRILCNWPPGNRCRAPRNSADPDTCLKCPNHRVPRTSNQGELMFVCRLRVPVSRCWRGAAIAFRGSDLQWLSSA